MLLGGERFVEMNAGVSFQKARTLGEQEHCLAKR